MLITTDTILCPGTYNFTVGLYVMGDGLLLDCNGALLQGNRTGRGVRTFGNHITIKNCKIDNYVDGIYSSYEHFGTFINNTFSNNTWGIQLDNSNNNKVINNIFINDGIKGWHSDQNVFENNIILDSTLGYYLHETDKNQFINNTIKNCGTGFHIWWYGYNNEFINNTIENCGTGFYFDWHSDYNLFEGNKVYNNNNGFYHASTWTGTNHDNTFINNEVKNNNCGFCMGSTFNCTFRENTIANNDYGFRNYNSFTQLGSWGYILPDSYINIIYNNNFINNTHQATSSNDNNTWDYNNEGNYWSDYDSEEERCYDSNYDGICDDPHIIDDDSQDDYPFTRKNGWLYDTILFKKNLIKGWNLISIPLELDNWTLLEPLQSIEGNYSKIFSYNEKWIELKNNSKINKTIGFWIKIKNDSTLTIEGTEIENPVYDLKQGWNLIGYPSLNETNISERFDNVTVYMYNNSNWYSYVRGRDSNSFSRFVPGYGYWVKK